MNNIKTVPHSVNIEQAVLGSLIQGNAPHIIEFLTPLAFYRESHRLIFNTVKELYIKNIPIDIMTVSEQLRRDDSLRKVGDTYYLTECIESVTSDANIEEHAKILTEKALLRELIGIATGITQEAYEDKYTAEEIINKANCLLSDLYLSQKIEDNIEIEKATHEWLEYWNRITENGHYDYIYSHVADIDDIVGGFQQGEYIIIAARPMDGKTALSLQIFWENIKRGLVAGFISLEATQHQIIQRLIAGETGISVKNIKCIPEGQRDFIVEQVSKKASEIGLTKGIINTSSDITTLELRNIATRMKKKHDIRLLMIDYLQLMRGRGENQNIKTTEISKAIKSLAKELNIPIFAISQLSRPSKESEQKIPKLSALRDSGSLEQDADVVIFIHWNETEKSEKTALVKIIIAKRRDGETGTRKAIFLKERMRFGKYESREE